MILIRGKMEKNSGNGLISERWIKLSKGKPCLWFFSTFASSEIKKKPSCTQNSRWKMIFFIENLHPKSIFQCPHYVSKYILLNNDVKFGLKPCQQGFLLPPSNLRNGPWKKNRRESLKCVKLLVISVNVSSRFFAWIQPYSHKLDSN